MVVILFAGVASAAPSITLAGAARAGAPVSFEFREDAAGTVLIDGCAPVEYERMDGERWVPVPAPACDAARVATVVDKALTVAAPAPAPGTYRAVLAWGAGCAEGRPFALSGCRQLDFGRSKAFEVR